MRRLVVALVTGLLSVSAAAPAAMAQEAVPEKRFVYTRDMDFAGTDLQSLFDTTQEACQRSCLNDPQCRAFTFNTRNNSCFPKSTVTAKSPYDGALSAVLVTADPAVIARARARFGDLSFLQPADFAQARNEAEALGQRHGGGQWTVDALLKAAAEERVKGNAGDAIHWTGAALAQSDDAGLWLQYADWSAEYARQITGSDSRKYANRAWLAALNGYLRSDGDGQRSDALVTLAQALEAQGRGRDMIPALTLADALGTRGDVAEMLDRAIGKYGFRITDHVVEADGPDPRICVEFNEQLKRVGVDYTPYVRLPDPKLAVTQDDWRICVTGVEHGSRHTLTFRAGLPAADGQTLAKDIPITAYVRDRAPQVAFAGRAYVLPRAADAGLPIETVNTSKVDLVLRRVSDANLIRSIQNDYFGRPIGQYAEEYFAEEIAEEIWRGTGDVQNEINRQMTTRLPMGGIVGELPAGIYALTAQAANDTDGEARATQWFLLSDIGLTTMQGTDGLTVFARDLATAAPLAGLEVTLLARANRPLQVAITDDDGVARFAPGLMRGTGGTAPAVVMAKQGEADLAFLSLTDPAFDLSDRGVEGRAPAGPLDAFLATDRGAYRAGEEIHLTALLRDPQALAVQDVPLIAVLTRPDGVEYTRHVSDGGMEGGHVFDLPLAPSVPRGTWRIAVFADPKEDALASETVLVEDFVPERIDFALDLPEGPINPLSPPDLKIDARYLFGAPGADLSIEGELRVATRTTLDAFPGYRFGRYDDESDTRTESFPADLVTNAGGRAELALPMPDTDALGRPMQARVTIRMAEMSGRPVERRITRDVAPPTPMIGIRPGAEVFAEDSTASFRLIAVGPDLKPAPMDVAWTVNRVTTRYQWYQNYGSWYWEPVTTRETVARGKAALGTDPVTVQAPLDWGRYEMVVERENGAYLASSAEFSAGWYAPVTESETPDMLELSLDKPAYTEGETATLRMVPRYAGKALVTVLADRVISMQAVEVREGENTLALPVTADWGAGVYVTAQVIRPMDVVAGQNPARALGLTHAAVDPGDARLAVSLDAPDESTPRAPLAATVEVANVADGENAYVTVAAVDVGILNLTGFQSPDPAGYYFGQRRLGVEIRDIYGRIINGLDGAMGTVNSGGDGGAGMDLQGPPPTEELVAFFSGVVPVKDGHATVAFDLPDFNGTVRLMAVAWSSQGVGSAEKDVIVRDPVVISAALPRFLAPGDESRLALEFAHTKGPAGDMALEITTDGGLLMGPIVDPITLAEGGKARMETAVSALMVGDHHISVALTTPDGQRLTKKLTLGVRANDPAVGRTRRFQLAAGQTFTADAEIFADLRPETASALVSAGPLARFDAPGLLASLDRYPYGCTEQVTSQALPLLYMSAIAEPLGLGNKDRIDLRIDQSITRILTRQDANGAFGLWGAYSGDAWLDAYVTDFLSRARAAGYTVPDHAFQSALDNLKNTVAYAADFDEGGEEIAYALMVLAREGAAAMGDLRYYADERADALGTALAQAQLGAALASYGDQPRADALFAKAAARIARTPVNAERIYRADYGTALRDAAGVLSLAVEARSDVADRAMLVTRVSAADRPLSTQEQAWALLAAHAMVQDPTASGLALNGAPLAGPFVRRLDAQTLQPTTLRNTGDIATDITLTTLGVPDGPTEASGYGYRLERAYYTLAGAPVTEIRTGDRMVAVLTVKPSDDTRARLMIDDPLPAGLEIDNPSLIRSGDVSSLAWLETTDAEFSEFRTDRFLAAVNQRDEEPFRLAYMLRAVSPGVFHHPAALVEDMYRPDYRATTASGTVTVLGE
ncbi:alpha-2-macroglobulin family protein [Sagittula salina]|uniref:Alpha-2-macroglobulin family protein n=1 Tax=Sagittula salina TaxID=2820268 RepID=A0A940MSH3_9RHOB|nr:alpha-2-macroglobulin family protein [Sagittula salina]MBP0483207.1 alpha-2-macroglobulin family protein [Sagittula salina]